MAAKNKAGGRKFTAPEINRIEELTARLIKLNAALEEKNRQLEQSELARKNMFSNISHDLRAPAAVIRGAAERICREDAAPEERRRMAAIIEARAGVLDRLVSDLYFSILIDQPEFTMSPVTLALAPVLEEYFIGMQESGGLRDRSARLEIPPGFCANVLIDPQYFIRVLDNLMSNAIRHTVSGDIIKLGCAECPDSARTEIYVSDSGSGIPPEDTPHIFEMTFTGTAARTPGETGSGLGLSILKTIVEKHGGTIRCDSEPGAGTTFTVSLPQIV